MIRTRVSAPVRRMVARFLSAPLAASLLIASNAAAITVNVGDPLGAQYDPASYFTAGFFGGVAEIRVTRANGSTSRASGALINTPGSSGLYVLTAAHVLTGDGSASVNVASSTINFHGGTSQLGAAYYVPSGWNGFFANGADIALIRLASPVAGIAGYDLLTDDSWIFGTAGQWGALATIAGYGQVGTGATGASGLPGPLRVARNLIDAGFLGLPGIPYIYDFDGGSAATDTFSVFAANGVPINLGVENEGLIAPGDSGGPSFVSTPEGRVVLAGVHSFGLQYFDPATGRLLFDVDGRLNSSFGEFAGDTRVAQYAGWIAQITSVPEPSTVSLIALLLIPVAIRARRFT